MLYGSVLLLKMCGQESQSICKSAQLTNVILFSYLNFSFDRLSDADFELFLVQSWLKWNQRNRVVHGGQMMDPRGLNKRALDYLDEYKKS